MASIRDFLVQNPKDVAARIVAEHYDTVVFVTPMLRAREIKLAAAARLGGWKVILIYSGTTPFDAGSHFDVAIKVSSAREKHALVTSLQPRLCHVFSGAVDNTIEMFCADKPSAVIADMNDVFVPSLFNYCEERFEPTRFVLKNADGFCARDLQAKLAQRLDGYELPEHILLFPEYSSLDGPSAAGAVPKVDDDEIRVVSVGSFTLESQGMYDSAYLQMAEMLTEQNIHFHIYPHWSYRDSLTSTFKMSLRRDLAGFFELSSKTPYLHIHKSASLEELASELPQYDFGIIAGGSQELGQRLELLTQNYMDSCYSGRIADYVDARLPILINKEVSFNTKLLRHYGIGHDLDGLTAPGFRERLQEIKKDDRQKENMARAANALSLQKNAYRLSRYYKKIAEQNTSDILRISPWMRSLKKVPLFARPFERFEVKLRRQNDTLRSLTAINRQFKNISTKQQLIIKRQEAARNNLLGRLDDVGKTATDLVSALSETKDVSDVNLPGIMSDLASIAEQAVDANENDAEGTIDAFDIDGTSRQLVEAYRANRNLKNSDNSSLMRADEVAGMLNWPEIIDEVEQRSSFAALIKMLHMFEDKKSSFSQHSEAWQLLAAKNLDQLLKHGFANFKRTIAANYFNFFVQNGDPQIEAVEALLTPEEKDLCIKQAKSLETDPNFDLQDQLTYWYFVAALWQYLRKTDAQGLTTRISEPAIGGPLAMKIDGVDVTQDLANSLLEYRSMSEGVDFKHTNRVLEIGAGHGRNAHAILSLNPNVQYFIVDIPPTLYISQRYLSSIFRDRTVFPVTDFSDFEAVRDEIEAASIIFLMPHQLLKLPDDYVQHSLSISSFGEMTRSQVQQYFDEIDRVSSETFYFKQWKKSINPFDKLDFTENEYPVNPRWQQEFSRTCAVQTEFFEALYRIK